MSTIRVVWGTASGPTKMSSYDAALAEANVHNYNLVAVSSVIPADATVEAVGTAPDLGPAGNRLTVVEARATRAGPGHVSAGLGWTTGDGPGLFYEAAGETDATEIEERVRAGLAAGRQLRDWEFAGESTETVTANAEPGTYVTAVVLAAYGESEPIC
ncbi:pyruvoyl-dependent arginine decarboxylase [Haladaptatus salinisoli]|uniref:pyruvoyl-dependent arginine decarboxylase n=1 Tax=Haladaptatus salinisoli TaxID=2884876 RepID=UPI001D0AD91F|nr:pyruvoyl-dependent arginine decarboxylase [Haladaptatus salinisoli]